MLRPRSDLLSGRDESSSFSTSSRPVTSRAHHSTLISTFLDDDEDVKGGRFAALFKSADVGSIQDSKSIEFGERFPTTPTTTGNSHVTGAEKSGGLYRVLSLQSHTRSSSPAVSPSRIAQRNYPTFEKKKGSPSHLHQTRPPLPRKRDVSEPRPVSAREKYRSVSETLLSTSRTPLKRISQSGALVQQKKQQNYRHDHQHRVEHHQYKEKKENRVSAPTKPLKVNRKSPGKTKTAVAPVLADWTSVLPNASKVVLRAYSPKVDAVQKGKLSRRKSFIESFVSSDNDLSGGKHKGRRAQSAAPVPGSRNQGSLSALPSKILRQQLEEDVAKFTAKQGTHSDAPPSSFSVNVPKDVSQPVESSLPEKASKKPLHDTEKKNNNTSNNNSLRVWREPPANVVLSDGDFENCVWSAAEPSSENVVNRDDWRQPLQAKARTKRRTEHSTTTRIPGVTTMSSSLRQMDDGDDDYHSIFHRGFKGNKKEGTKGHRSASVSAVANKSRSSDRVPCSRAAGSALLQQPQYLLDSDALKSMDSFSRHKVERNVNQLLGVLASGSTRPPLLQAEKQHIKYIALSHSAKVLYAAILYLRTLGGFPSLLHINPLTEDDEIVGKEHCLELVFARHFFEGKGARSRSWDQVDVKAQQPFGKRRQGVPGMEDSTTLYKKNSSLPMGLESDELIVVVRSVIAESSVVTRFNNTELVHILPPLESAVETQPDSNSAIPTLTSSTAPSNETVLQLLQQAESSFGSVRFKEPRGLADSRQSGKDYGDLAVAFLNSASASQVSSALPEPKDLEMMHYQIFTLNKDKAGGMAGTLKTRNMQSQSLFSQTQQQQQQQHQEGRRNSKLSRSSFEQELIKMSEDPLMGSQREYALFSSREATYPWDHMRRRFPSYSSVTIAESTLLLYCDEKDKTCSKSEKQGGKNEREEERESLDGCFVPGFRRLCLPRFHMDLVDSLEYVLHMEQRERNAKTVRENFRSSLSTSA